MRISTETVAILATMGGLFGFGVGYALFINWLRKEGYSEGYTAFLVVGGVLVTVVVSTFVHQPHALPDLLLELACFAASGLPMVANDVHRYRLARQADQQYIKEMGGGNGAA